MKFRRNKQIQITPNVIQLKLTEKSLIIIPQEIKTQRLIENNLYLVIGVNAAIALILLLICGVLLVKCHEKRKKIRKNTQTDINKTNVTHSPRMTNNSLFGHGNTDNQLYMLTLPSKSARSTHTDTATEHTVNKRRTTTERRESEEKMEIEPTTLTSINTIPFEHLPPPESLPHPSTYLGNSAQTLPEGINNMYNINNEQNMVNSAYDHGNNNMEYVDYEDANNIKVNYTDQRSNMAYNNVYNKGNDIKDMDYVQQHQQNKTVHIVDNNMERKYVEQRIEMVDNVNKNIERHFVHQQNKTVHDTYDHGKNDMEYVDYVDDDVESTDSSVQVTEVEVPSELVEIQARVQLHQDRSNPMMSTTSSARKRAFL